MSSSNGGGSACPQPEPRTRGHEPLRASGERGPHTRSQKNPGKRPHQGGS
jgi:hypothetical protein